MRTRSQHDERPRVSITAAGVVSPFGVGIDPLWRALVAGENAFVTRRELDADHSVPVAAAGDGGLDARLCAEDRTLALCAAAFEQLAATPGLRRIARERLGVCFGSTQGAIDRWGRERGASGQGQRQGRAHLPDAGAPLRALVRRSGARGPLANPSMACATGTAAIGVAVDWIRGGHCDAVLAGGADALSDFVLRGFAALRALDPDGPRPFDAQRAGLGLGEAAAVLLLERGHHPGCVEVAGWGMASDANHLTGPDPQGGGAARAIGAALADAGLGPADVDHVNAHGTGTVYNDRMEARAFGLAFGEHLPQLPVNAIKGAVGHSLAAAGALEAIVCAEGLTRGLIPPTANLTSQDPEISMDIVRGAARQRALGCTVSSSSGFGGINAALVLTRPRV